MIPNLVDIGDRCPWPVLPPGIHWATHDDVEDVFVTNSVRRRLYEGFSKATFVLGSVGCKKIYLDGSFVTGKPLPNDFDACWDPEGVDFLKLKSLDPTLLDFSNGRKEQKLKYGGELFVSDAQASVGSLFLEFFQIEKISGNIKGIIGIRLTG